MITFQEIDEEIAFWEQQPEGTYGYYETDNEGRKTLALLNPFDEREAYSIEEGTEIISEGTFCGQTYLKKLHIPASVRCIADGALSNAGGWFEGQRGLEAVSVSEENPFFFTRHDYLYKRLENGNRKLVLYFGDSPEITISETVELIAKDAFKGASFKRLSFAANGFSYAFPQKHTYFMEVLQKGFGEGGKKYDFSEYDALLLRDHLNADRIQMICDRLNMPWNMDPQIRMKVRERMENELEDALKALVKEDAFPQLWAMSEAGIFTEENIDAAIDVLNHSEQREMLHYLMTYKNSHFADTEPDFEI